MATVIQSFDPVNFPTGSFNCGLQSGGWLFIHNESPMTMLFDLGSNQGTVLVSSNAVRCIRAGLGTDRVTYKAVAEITQPTNALLSRVYAEAYAPSEWEGGEQYWPLSGPLYQQRVVSLPMTAQFRQPNRVVLPTDVQVAPIAAQALLNTLTAGSASTNGFAFIYSVEAQPVTVGQCVIALGLMTLTGGGALSNFFTPFGYYDLSRGGWNGPTQGVYENFPTPRAVGLSYVAGEANVAVYYYLFDGYGGMTVDVSVHWSIMNASAVGLTNIAAPGSYGQGISFSRTLY